MSRQERQAEKLRADIRALKTAAKHAEIVTEALESPFVQRWLFPYIENRMRAFLEGIWTLPPERFPVERAEIEGLRSIRSRMLALDGKRDELLEQAATKQGHLEAAEKRGLIMPSETE